MSVSLYPIQYPSTVTLKKYGLTLEEWLELYTREHGECHLCHRVFEPGKRINVDHVHVRGWKDMPPEKRKTFIRGLLCYRCNRFVTMRGVTTELLIQGYHYLRNFEVRITPESLDAQNVRNRRKNKPARTTDG
jgi:hypothetical protein